MALNLRSLSWLALGLALASPAAAQDSLIAGFNFGQFIGSGYPSTDGTTGDPVGSIAANFKGTSQPAITTSGVYRANNGIAGAYDPGYATWYWDGSHNSGTFDFSNGVDVVVYEKGGVNAINAATVHGYNMIGADDNFAGLSFSEAGKKWSITTSTIGYADTTTASNFSFAAYATGGTATMEWFINGAETPFATSTITAGSDYTQYAVDLPSSFYGKSPASIQGRLTSSGKVTFDNVQINGSLAQPPTFTQQPTGQTVTAGADVSFTVTVTGATAPTYRWYLNGSPLSNGSGVAGAATPTLSLSSVTLASAGSYTVVVDNNGVAAESDPAVLAVQTAPAFVIQPAPNVANPGQNVSFEVQVSGAPAPALQWEKDGVPLNDGPGISGSTGATLTLTGVDVSSAGDYRVVAVNAVGTTASDIAQLTITVDAVAPAIATPPALAMVNVGQTAMFQVTATGAPAPSYQWRFEGADLVDDAMVSGATTRTLTLTGVTAGRAGDYTVVVTNSAGSIDATATLVVRTMPVIDAGSQPVSRTVTAGDPVTLSVGAVGIPAPTFQWRKNGLPIDGATGASYTIDKVTLDHEGDYTVVVSNVVGSVESVIARLTVHTLPEIVSSPASLTAAKGGSVLLSVQATGTPDPVYQWYKDGQAISGATDSSYVIASVSAGDAGSYSVRVENTAGAVVSKTATLRVSQPVEGTTPTVLQVFSPGSVLSFGQLGASSGSIKYRWYLNGKVISGATSPFFVIESAQSSDSGTYTIKTYNSLGKVVATRTVARVEITVANTYNALLRDPVSDEPVGRLAVTINKTGAYSGRLLFEDGRSYALRGKFTFDSSGYVGTSVLPIKRAKGLGPLELVLSLDALAAELEAGLSPVSNDEVLGSGIGVSQTASAAWQGTYTLMLAPISPAADTITATAVIDAKGVLKLAGRTTDGQAFKVSVPGGIDGSYAIFVQLYGKSGGQLAGSLKLVEAGGVYAATPASSGLFTWFKPAGVGSVPGVIDLTFEPSLTP